MDKVKFVELSLDCVIFHDVYGVVRTSYGCSLLGLEESVALFEKLDSIIQESNEDKTIAGLYSKNKWFKYCCNRLLELNGINPDWVNPVILTALLFAYEGKVGLLRRLNYPNRVVGSSQETSNAIAQLFKATNDLKTTLEVAQNEPWKTVLKAFEKPEKVQQSEDEWREGLLKEFQDWQKVAN